MPMIGILSGVVTPQGQKLLHPYNLASLLFLSV